MIQLDAFQKSEWIKNEALALGFYDISFAKAEFMEEEAERLRQWLNENFHGEMRYMENHFEKRTDPSKLLEGTKSVICLAYNYFTNQEQDPSAPKIAKYAYGKDYHKVVKKKLKLLCQSIENKFGPFNHRYFVDSAPLLERDLAKRSGLGWIGKNTLLINPKKGSYFFLAEILVDFELDYGSPIKDYCGTCTKCIEACPTDAIDKKGYLMDGSKCISYATIEFKEDQLPAEFEGKLEDWMFGCDICQEVCPWNRFSTEHNESLFEAKEALLQMTRKDWTTLEEDEFNALFEGSAVKRTGYSGLKRNINHL